PRAAGRWPPGRDRGPNPGRGRRAGTATRSGRLRRARRGHSGCTAGGPVRGGAHVQHGGPGGVQCRRPPVLFYLVATEPGQSQSPPRHRSALTILKRRITSRLIRSYATTSVVFDNGGGRMNTPHGSPEDGGRGGRTRAVSAVLLVLVAGLLSLGALVAR